MAFVFFREWGDSPRMKFFQFFLLGGFLFLYLWFLTVPTEVTRAILYLIMLVVCGGIMLIDAIAERNPFVAWAGLGDLKRAIPAFILGGLIMLIGYSTTTLSLSAPLAIISDQNLLFIYVVSAAPFIEETFFRGTFFHTVGLNFKGNGIPFPGFFALIALASLFAVFHGIAYNWAIGGLALAFTFSIFATIGNQVFKTTAFSMGAHFVNNFLVFLVTFKIIVGI